MPIPPLRLGGLRRNFGRDFEPALRGAFRGAAFLFFVAIDRAPFVRLRPLGAGLVRYFMESPSAC